MSSTMRNGFSTLNRLLGKKNKDTSMSKSVSNLSTLDTSSQHNKIIPLAASNNAPFEQTFRITICLPRDQLYVVRVGAKTKLRQLLETVCVSKQLDRDKFEFRHPDGSQTYDNDMTIGEVGLNEIRLADKNDKTYIKFNTDELMKLRHMSRESLTSSSDFSKGSNKQSNYSKTISPYSSTNSLNSMDSATGMNPNHHNYNHSHNNNHNNNRNSLHHPPVAPQRKKRVAPRPPSQNSITEHQVVESVTSTENFKKPLPLALPRKAFHVSTPNLNGNHNSEPKLTLINNNNNNSNVVNKNIEDTDVKIRNGSFSRPPLPPPGARPVTQSYASSNTGSVDEGRRQSLSGSASQLNHSRTSSESSDHPTPTKRTFVASARKKAPPAPPPRLVIPVDIASSPEPTIVEEVSAAAPTNTSPTTASNPNISKVMLNVDPVQPPTPRVIEIDSRDLPSTTPSSPANLTDEPRSLESKTDSSDEEDTKIYNIKSGKPITIQDNTVAKPPTAKPSATIIAEVPHTEPFKESSPVRVIIETPKSPVINKSLTIIQNTTEPESRAESPLWTYTLPAPPKFADSELAAAANPTITTTDRTDLYNGESLTTGSSDTATIVSDLSDLSDIPIRPIINERMPLDFQVFNDASTIGDDAQSVTASDVEDGYQSFGQRFSREAVLKSLERRRDQFIESEFKFLTTEEPSVTYSEVVDTKPEADIETLSVKDELVKDVSVESIKPKVIEELKEAIAIPRVEAISKPVEQEAIAGYDANTLSNFSINTYSTEKETAESTPASQDLKEDDEYTIPRVETLTKKPHEDVTSEPEKPTHFMKRPSLTNGSLAMSRINRSDSFHSTRPIEASAVETHTTPLNGLTPRSSSYISLIGTQKFENRTLRAQYSDSSMRRNSSSELSIADSPSLQSLSVMKSILSNSRKNSLNTEAATLEIELVKSDVLKRNTSVTDIKMQTVEAAADQVDRAKVAPERPAGNVTITQLNSEAPTTKVPEKKWSYQGPPSISMSTWGERPKTTVSIKTDKDYKSSDTPQPPRNHFGEVAPRKIAVSQSPSVEHDRTPIIRGVVPKMAGVTPAEPTNISIRRPSYEISTYIVDKPLHEATTTMTLGRVPMPNRWSTYGTHAAANPAPISTTNIAAASAVTVKAFKVADPVNSHTTSTTLNSTSNYAIAKDGSFDSGYKSMPPVYSELAAVKQAQADAEPPAVSAPFSQFTLRKTGLKDKILADPTARNVTKPTVADTPVVSSTTVQLRSVNGNGQASQRPFTVPTFVAPAALVKPVDAPKKSVGETVPPPPPPSAGLGAPVIRAVTAKKTLPAPQADPRDQLLDAIRNFSKGGLKKQ